jgi:hypothetical protein
MHGLRMEKALEYMKETFPGQQTSENGQLLEA